MTQDRVSIMEAGMSVHRTITAIATDFIRFGSFLAVDGDRCSPDPQRIGTGGIAKRPHQAGASGGYHAGETVTVLTDGGVQAHLAEGQRWAQVNRGRVVLPGDNDPLAHR
jgi:hypothetical protein